MNDTLALLRLQCIRKHHSFGKKRCGFSERFTHCWMKDAEFSGDLFLWKVDDDFRDFVFESPAARIAQQVLGSKVVRHFYDPFANAPAATAATAAGDPAALGRIIFEETAGGVGCAYCHGMDGTGNQVLGGPDIRGETSERVRGALTDVDFMSEIRLNDDEIAAVVSHLQQLADQP